MMEENLEPLWSTKRYLLIDDFSIMHRMLREMLQHYGATQIDAVKNGSDAIALLQQNQYDVVLCDYHLAEGPNGQQILEEAKHRELVGLSCIWMMVSSEKAIESVMGAAELSPDGYILKPLTESLLKARLNRAWDKKQVFTQIDRAYATKDYRRAIALCDDRLASHKIHTRDLLRMKANLLLKCGDFKNARTVYEQALAERDQVWAKTGIARLHIRNGDYPLAEKLLNEVLEENPSYLDAYDQLALTLEKLGAAFEAAQVLEKAARLSPYSVMRQKNLGAVAMKLGNIELAEKAFRTCIDVGEQSIHKTPDAYLGLARVYGMQNQPLQALQLLDTVRHIFEGDQIRLRVKIAESQVYADSGQAEKARETAEAVRQHVLETDMKLGVDGSLEMAQLLSATGDEEATVEILQQAIENIHETASAGKESPLTDLTRQIDDLFSTAEPDGAAVEIVRQKIDPTGDRTANENDNEHDAANRMTGAKNVSEEKPAELPPNVRALFARALVLIQYMQKNGHNSVTADEARSVLLRIEKLASGQPRSQELLGMLRALSIGEPDKK